MCHHEIDQFCICPGSLIPLVELPSQAARKQTRHGKIATTSHRIHIIRPVTPYDGTAICAIYKHYVATSTIGFEEDPVSVADIRDVGAQKPWYVFELDDRVIGYDYATPWRVRGTFRFSVESTVYMSPEHGRNGVGAQLHQEWLEELRTRDVHVVLGSIAQRNTASIALHEYLSFQKVAHFREVSFKFGNWVDVGYWQLLLSQG